MLDSSADHHPPVSRHATSASAERAVTVDPIRELGHETLARLHMVGTVELHAGWLWIHEGDHGREARSFDVPRAPTQVSSRAMTKAATRTNLAGEEAGLAWRRRGWRKRWVELELSLGAAEGERLTNVELRCYVSPEQVRGWWGRPSFCDMLPPAGSFPSFCGSFRDMLPPPSQSPEPRPCFPPRTATQRGHASPHTP